MAESSQAGGERDPNAPWLATAHMLCTDHGIPQGHIEERLKALRAALSAPPAPVAAVAQPVVDDDHERALKLLKRLEDADELWKGWSGAASTLVELKHAIGGMAQKLALRTAALAPSPSCEPSAPEAAKLKRLIGSAVNYPATARSKAWVTEVFAMIDAIAQAAPAPASEAVVQPITAAIMVDDGGDLPAYCLMASFRTSEQVNAALRKITEGEAMAQPAADLDVLLAKFHLAVWAAASNEDEPIAYDMAGVAECKAIQAHVRRLRVAAQGAYELLSSGLPVADKDYCVVTELAAALQSAKGGASHG